MPRFAFFLILLSLLMAAPASAKTFTYPSYSITLPEGWTEFMMNDKGQGAFIFKDEDGMSRDGWIIEPASLPFHVPASLMSDKELRGMLFGIAKQKEDGFEVSILDEQYDPKKGFHFVQLSVDDWKKGKLRHLVVASRIMPRGARVFFINTPVTWDEDINALVNAVHSATVSEPASWGPQDPFAKGNTDVSYPEAGVSASLPGEWTVKDVENSSEDKGTKLGQMTLEGAGRYGEVTFMLEAGAKNTPKTLEHYLDSVLNDDFDGAKPENVTRGMNPDKTRGWVAFLLRHNGLPIYITAVADRGTSGLTSAYSMTIGLSGENENALLGALKAMRVDPK